MKFYYLKPYLVNDSAPQQGVRIRNVLPVNQYKKESKHHANKRIQTQRQARQKRSGQ